MVDKTPGLYPDLAVLERAIGYRFNDISLLSLALRHKSHIDKDASTVHGINNERLEFLGDAVLSVVTANFLYRQKGFLSEGNLSRLRAQYVCQNHLSAQAKLLDLGDFILSDKAMRSSGSNHSNSVLSDAMEAIFGAVFVDGGLEGAEKVIFTMLGKPSIKVVVADKDAKTKLQEVVQALTQSAPKYVVLESKGPAHAPTFVVGVKIADQIVATAAGENKKVAAQNAACIALEKYTSL